MFSAVSLIALLLAAAGQHPSMPRGMSHEEHLKQLQKEKALDERGAEAMGFDQHAAAHHFRLAIDGGAIEVAGNARADENTIAAIRRHLRAIAAEFAAGRFDKPSQTHAEVPPGVVLMRENRDKIAYRYEDLPRGGVVRIVTKDAEVGSPGTELEFAL